MGSQIEAIACRISCRGSRVFVKLPVGDYVVGERRLRRQGSHEEHEGDECGEFFHIGITINYITSLALRLHRLETELPLPLDAAA